MQVVNFSFRPTVPVDRRQSLLREINDWPEVKQARHLDDQSPDSDVARLAYAYLQPGHAAAALVQRLRSLPDIETADEPARRGIA